MLYIWTILCYISVLYCVIYLNYPLVYIWTILCYISELYCVIYLNYPVLNILTLACFISGLNLVINLYYLVLYNWTLTYYIMLPSRAIYLYYTVLYNVWMCYLSSIAVLHVIERPQPKPETHTAVVVKPATHSDCTGTKLCMMTCKGKYILGDRGADGCQSCACVPGRFNVALIFRTWRHSDFHYIIVYVIFVCELCVWIPRVESKQREIIRKHMNRYFSWVYSFLTHMTS